MKRKRRFAFFGGLLLSIMMGVSGCMMSSQWKIDQMLEHMHEKYGDDVFTYDHITGGYLGSSTTSYIVYSQRFPNRPIKVNATKTDDGVFYWDTYVSVKYEQQTRELLTQRMEQVFGKNCYVEYVYNPNNAAVSGPDGGNRSFEEYIAHNGSLPFSVTVNLIPEKGDETMVRVKEVLADVDVFGFIDFFDASDVVLDESTVRQIRKECPFAMSIHIYTEEGPNGFYNEYAWRIQSLYKEETTTLAKSRIEQAFGPDCYISSSTYAHASCDFASIPTFEEYIATSGNEASILAIVKYSPADETETLKRVREMFADIVIDGALYSVDDATFTSIADLDERAMQDIACDNYLARVFFRKKDLDSYYRCEFEWRK